MSKASKSRCAAAFSFVDLVNQGIADFLSCLGREDRGSRIPPKEMTIVIAFSQLLRCGWVLMTFSNYTNIRAAFHVLHWFFYYYVACSSRSYTFVSQACSSEIGQMMIQRITFTTRSSSEPWRWKTFVYVCKTKFYFLMFTSNFIIFTLILEKN